MTTKRKIPLGATFLYTGHVKVDASGKRTEPEPGSVEPLRNIVLVAPLSKKGVAGWWKYAQEKYLDEKVIVFNLADAAANKVVLRAGIPEKRTKLQQTLGTRTGKGIEKNLAVMGTALDVLNVALAFNELFAAEEKVDSLKSELKRLSKDVDRVLHKGACREGIGTLERMRTAAVAAKLGAEAAEGQAIMAAIDLALGTLTMLGIGGPALAMVVAVKSAVGLVVDAAESLDKHVLDGVINDKLALQSKIYTLAKLSHANQALLPDSVENGGTDDFYAQYLLRAEALTGLVRLLMRASMNAKNDSEYLSNVRAMDVEGYIKQILLGDGWQFPLRPAIPIGMDSVWLQRQGFFMKEVETDTFADLMGYTKPLDAAKAIVFPHIMAPLAVFTQIQAGSAKAQYQGPFPLHHLDSAKVEDLALAFMPHWNALKKKNIAHTCVYRRPRDSKEESDWEYVYKPGAKSASDLPLLSPFDQIRVLLVMDKDEVAAGQYPVALKLKRVDGWNVEGPTYPEIMRVLDQEELLPEEKGFIKEGSVGCVFYPFYCFGPQTIPGVKPLVGTYWRGSNELPRFLDDMRYSFEVIFGNNSSGSYVDLGGPGGKPCGLNEIRTGISTHPDEKKLITLSFLTRLSANSTYPRIFEDMSGAEPCYARVGKAPYVLATPEERANRVFSSFNWWEPVEFVVVVWANKLAHRDSEAESIEWDRLNIKVKLVNFDGVFNTDGPTYDSTLEYVGMLKNTRETKPEEIYLIPAYYEEWRKWGHSRHDHPVRGAGNEVKEWLDQMCANRAETLKLAAAIDPDWSTKAFVYYLFAAHFRLDYYAPSGKRYESLRPFGKILTNSGIKPGSGNAYYRIGLRDIQITTGETNLVWGESKAPGHRMPQLRSEYEFHFLAPVSGAPVPWKGLGEKADEADITKWITKDTTLRNPQIELLARPSK